MTTDSARPIHITIDLLTTTPIDHARLSGKVAMTAPRSDSMTGTARPSVSMSAKSMRCARPSRASPSSTSATVVRLGRAPDHELVTAFAAAGVTAPRSVLEEAS